MNEKQNKGIAQTVWNVIETMADFVIRRVLHLKIGEKQWDALMQFVKFGIVGLSNTIISYVIYVVSLLAFQKNNLMPSYDYLVAQVIAFILSVLWSFYWNNKFVFRKEEGEERSILRTLMKTYISYAFTGLFLNSILSILWVEFFGIPKMLAPIINLLISVPLNYLINKFWAFGNKKDR